MPQSTHSRKLTPSELKDGKPISTSGKMPVTDPSARAALLAASKKAREEAEDDEDDDDGDDEDDDDGSDDEDDDEDDEDEDEDDHGDDSVMSTTEQAAANSSPYQAQTGAAPQRNTPSSPAPARSFQRASGLSPEPIDEQIGATLSKMSLCQ
jgi:hypothetical protein